MDNKNFIESFEVIFEHFSKHAECSVPAKMNFPTGRIVAKKIYAYGTSINDNIIFESSSVILNLFQRKDISLLRRQHNNSSLVITTYILNTE